MKNQSKIETESERCENCGGIIKFSPLHQNLICDNCGTIKAFEKEINVLKHDINEKPDENAYKKWVKQSKFVSCESCGAKLVLGQYELSKTCPYCGSEYISQIKFLPGLKPDGIIPFKFDKLEASKKFKKSVKKKFFLPRKFKKLLPESAIHGIYVPAFSFDANTESTYNGSLVKSETYRINGRSESIDRAFNIHGKNSNSYNDILVESSSKISNYDLEGILPFNMSEAYKFNSNFIKGYSVEHYQDVLDTCHEIAKSIMTDRIRKQILEDYDYSSINNIDVDTKFSKEKYAYYLLPIYNFEYKYNKKTYITQMNGQTGKVGHGLPISGWKVGILIGLGLLAVAGLAWLFFIGGRGI